MKGYKISATVLMFLAVIMMLLPFYKLSLPSYFEKGDCESSGAGLFQAGIQMSKSEIKENVEGIRDLIKDSSELESLYDALGKAGRLAALAKMCAVFCLFVPWLLFIAGGVICLMGIVKEAKIYSMLSLWADALALVLIGGSGACALIGFRVLKKKLTDGVASMSSVSTGISFLDTILDSASDVVSENLDKIKLSPGIGWILSVLFAAAALACLIIVCARQKQEKAVSSQRNDAVWMNMDEIVGPDLDAGPHQAEYGASMPQQYQDVSQSGYFGREAVSEYTPKQNPGMRQQNIKEDPPTYRSPLAADINSYQLVPVNPQQPSGVMYCLEGTYQGDRIPMRTKVVIGRDGSCANLVLGGEYKKVSRKHCEITYDAARRKYRIHDYSKNGVTLHIYQNQKYVTKGLLPKEADYYLAPGTIIDIGSAENRFRLE